MLKLNMGCGRNKLPDYVNVDSAEASSADLIFDLETTPWPWADDSASEVRFIHSLEHMGADAKVFLAMMGELYRIAAPGCRVVIHAPHPRHDFYIGDPTHVRPITPEMLKLFDRDLNDAWVAAGNSNTPLAHYLGVDFHVVETRTMIEQPFLGQLRSGQITETQLVEIVRRQCNVAYEFRIVLEARKPAR